MPAYRYTRIILPLMFLAASGAAGAVPPQNEIIAMSPITGFREVMPEELHLTSEPGAPGASAVILFREVYRNDTNRAHREDDYFRIKILTEEGRKYADVEIPFVPDRGRVGNVHARTIKPDGSTAEFDGKVFVKTIAKAKGLKYQAVTFSFPGVQPGCILEYYYSTVFNEEYIYDSHWIISDELFTHTAKFALVPYTSDYVNYHLRWLSQNMPQGSPQATEGADHIIRLQVENIPAFPTEDFMPPENELKQRVDFSYSLDTPENDANKFWSKTAKRMNGHVDGFCGKHGALEAAVSETVAATDTPETKLRKLYARVQQLRNTDYEVQKTLEEEKRDKEKESGNAEDVWKRGYGDSDQLNWLYLALVRAAGFEASAMKIADRQQYFFNPYSMESSRLNKSLVVVKLNGTNVYCSPGSPFTPFGLLPWQETSMKGLLLDKKEGTWSDSLMLTSTLAQTARRADLTLTDTGDLEGKVTVTYTGLEGARLRFEQRNADATERKSQLENLVRSYVPAACEVKLTNQPDWKSSDPPLVAEFHIRIPGWAAPAGHHVLISAGVFSNPEKHVFEHAARIHPIYFEYPSAKTDDISIHLPAGWQVSSLPQGWKDTGRVVTYNFLATNDHGTLHITRSLAVEFLLLEAKYYPALRNYFQQVKTNDEQQIVLEPGAATASAAQ